MVWYFVHLVVGLVWDSLYFSRLSPDGKMLELLLQGQQVLILHRCQKRGPTLMRSEMLILVTLVEQFRHVANLQKAQMENLILILKPETLLRWHRELVRHKRTSVNTPKASEQLPTEPHLVQIGLQLARKNQWSDARITSALKKLGHWISHETVRKILRSHGMLPVPTRKGSSHWRTFVSQYKATSLARDYVIVETIRLQTLYVLFLTEIGTRCTHVGGITPQPTQRWVAQQARQLLWNLVAEERLFTHLVHDNDGTESAAFDAVIGSERIEGVTRPFASLEPTPTLMTRGNATGKDRCARCAKNASTRLSFSATGISPTSYTSTSRISTKHVHIKASTSKPCPPVSRLTSGNVARRDILGGVFHGYYGRLE